jgi:hypothetical protein
MIVLSSVTCLSKWDEEVEGSSDRVVNYIGFNGGHHIIIQIKVGFS